MPKNYSGGNRAKKGKNSGPAEPGAIVYADKDQCYGSIIKNIGNGQITLLISKLAKESSSATSKGERFKTFEAIGRPRGLLRKRRTKYIEGGIVLCSERDFEMHSDGTAVRKTPLVDILLVYDPSHSRRLILENRVSPEFSKAFTTSQARTATASGSTKKEELLEAEDGFEFRDAGDDDDDAGDDKEEIDIDDL
jgi:hypothetical protein